MLALAFFGSSPAVFAEGFNVSFSRVIGGPLDADDPDPGFGNLGYQAGFSFATAPRTRVALRVAELQFEGELYGQFVEPELTFATLTGEYSLDAGFYESSVFLGLGGYRLEGNTIGGLSDEESTLGLVVGTAGEFPIYRRLSTIIELSGHYIDLNSTGAQLYAFLTVGFGFDF
jgi:hypothetical protein